RGEIAGMGGHRNSGGKDFRVRDHAAREWRPEGRRARRRTEKPKFCAAHTGPWAVRSRASPRLRSFRSNTKNISPSPSRSASASGRATPPRLASTAPPLPDAQKGQFLRLTL